MKYEINPDIKKASTLPSEYYSDQTTYEKSKDSIFHSSWLFISEIENIKVPGQVYPIRLLENFLDEPLLLTRDFNDKLHCISNVCTHRGMLVCENSDNLKSLRCRYHGRKFKIDGEFESMPEYDGVEDFPTSADNLPKVNHHILGEKFVFASTQPKMNFSSVFGDMMKRVGFLPLIEFTYDQSRSRDYLINSHWALYCDNYLEGFHIPYVHSGLNQILDYGSYEVELYEYSSLQLGIADKGELTFNLPVGHPDHGKNIAAYYYWIWPNMMFNFYPWGLSMNFVKPLGINRTKVSFTTYIWKPDLLDKGAGSGLDRVEREDEVVVEAVQIGIKSKLYKQGRFSPVREQGVHHFHSLLAKHS